MKPDKYQAQLDHAISTDTRVMFWQILCEAAEAKQRIIEEDEVGLFRGEMMGEMHGRLLGYVIRKFFSPDFLPGNFMFRSRIQKINNFGYYVPILEAQGISAYVVKMMDFHSFPTSSYIKRHATPNGQRIYQLSLFDEFQPESDYPMNLLLAYTSKTRRCIDDARIILPDNRLKGSLAYIQVKPAQTGRHLTLVDEVHFADESKEKRLTRLKKDVKKDLMDI